MAHRKALDQEPHWVCLLWTFEEKMVFAGPTRFAWMESEVDAYRAEQNEWVEWMVHNEHLEL